MKYIIPLVLALPLIAAVQIHTIYYDAFNETGSEFILLENTGLQTVNLTGWHIATPTSENDAILVGTLEPQKTFLIADSGWNEGRDNLSWILADYEEALTLPNTNGFVQLLSENNTLIDTVGWGDAPRYEGTPHTGIDEGNALVRTANTHNNSVDFNEQPPVFTTTPPEGGSSTALNITVENTAPKIEWTTVEDDDEEQEGVQLLPLPGGQRMIAVQANVSDDNGVQTVHVYANGNELVTNSSDQQGIFSGTIPLTTNTTEIHFLIEDEQTTISAHIPIELLAVVGLRIPESTQTAILPGKSANTTLIIENIGTVPAALHIAGTKPSFAGKVLGEIRYTLAGQEFLLLETGILHNLAIQPGQQTAIGLSITAGYVPAGVYSGQIIIAGEPA